MCTCHLSPPRRLVLMQLLVVCCATLGMLFSQSLFLLGPGRLGVFAVLLLPLAYLTCVGLLPVQFREDKVKHFAVPLNRVALYAFFDVL